ncbi:MAG: phage holin family protein [Myxococcales bacterium]|nr:phage holin family protein [Myxococcales bacterium]
MSMQPSRHDGAPPLGPESVWTAMVRVYDTGQRLVLERIELAKLELIGFARGELVVIARQLARNAVLALAGSILLLAGWFVLSWGVVNLVASGLSSAWRFVIDAGINVAVGGVLLWLAARGPTRALEKIDP